MLFTNLDNKKNYLQEEINRLQGVIASLYKERDAVYNDILDTRRGQTEVYSETTKLQSDLSDLEQSLLCITDVLIDEHKNFYTLTDKQKAKILELNNLINSKISELDEYNKKELIDIDGENVKHNLIMIEQRKQEQELRNNIQSMKTALIEFEDYKNTENNRLIELNNNLNMDRKLLNDKEFNLNMLEARLTKLNKENNKGLETAEGYLNNVKKQQEFIKEYNRINNLSNN